MTELAASVRERFPPCRPLELGVVFETARWYSDGLDLVEMNGDIYFVGGSDIELAVDNTPIGLRKGAGSLKGS